MLNRLMSTQVSCLLYCLAYSMCHGFVNVSYSSPTRHTIFSWKYFSMPRDRVRWTCLYYTFFLSLLPPSPHTRQLVWSLGDLRLSQLEHQSSHRSGPWLLCSGYFLFVPRTRPLITFSYILPSSLSLHLMSFLSFLFCP